MWTFGVRGRGRDNWMLTDRQLHKQTHQCAQIEVCNAAEIYSQGHRYRLKADTFVISGVVWCCTCRQRVARVPQTSRHTAHPEQEANKQTDARWWEIITHFNLLSTKVDRSFTRIYIYTIQVRQTGSVYLVTCCAGTVFTQYQLIRNQPSECWYIMYTNININKR